MVEFSTLVEGALEEKTFNLSPSQLNWIKIKNTGKLYHIHTNIWIRDYILVKYLSAIPAMTTTNFLKFNFLFEIYSLPMFFIFVQFSWDGEKLKVFSSKAPSTSVENATI